MKKSKKNNKGLFCLILSIMAILVSVVAILTRISGKVSNSISNEKFDDDELMF